MDIVLTGRAAERGARRIYEENRERLGEIYASGYLTRGIKSLEDAAPSGECMELISGHCDRSGGCFRVLENESLYGALWLVLQETDSGARILFDRIETAQFTVEMCEFADVNPCLEDSSGCCVCVCQDGQRLADSLNGKGLPAAVIGYTTGDKKRVVVNGEVVTYLTGRE